MSDVVTSPIARCPPELIARTWEFLDERSLARCEAVCTGWRAQIASPDQHVWRSCCQITNRYNFPSREELSEGLKVFEAQPKCDELTEVFTTERTFELIFSYAHDDNTNYKGLAEIIHGMVVMDCRSVYLTMPDKVGCFAQLPWGRSAIEPYIYVAVFNEESLEITERAFERGDSKTAMRLRGEWGCGYPRIPTGRFPTYLPLRLFYNRDGSLKNHGDQLQLNYKGKRVLLECTFNDYMRSTEERIFQNYAEAIAYRIDVSVRNFRWISPSDITAARAAAMADPREWIPSEES